MPEKIPSLDGLRALSISIVFLSHVLLATGGRLEFGHGHGLMIPGAFGVTVFFFLSGFLITTLLRKEYDAAESISFRGFYLRRLLRIFPPLYAVLVLVWLLCRASVIQYPFTLPKVLAAGLQGGNYWTIARGQDALPPGTGVLWSLAVEEHFYLLFPLLYSFLRRSGREPHRQAMVLWAICAGFLVWRLVLVFAVHGSIDHLRLATDTRMDSILFGCALAIWGNPALDPTRFSKRTWTLILLPVGLLGIVLGHVIPGPARDAFKDTTQGISLVPIFCAAVRFPTWGPLRLLNTRPVVFLGVLSYSFYLIHFVLIMLLYSHTSQRGPIFCLTALAASSLAAWAMYVFIERPCNRLRHKLPAARAAAPRSAIAPGPALGPLRLPL